MKKLVKNMAVLALLISATACQEKLDTVSGDAPVAAYMSLEAAKITFPKGDQGGETFMEPRLSHLATEDTKISVSVEDFLKAYNERNKTKYVALPASQFTLYEVDNPTNTSNNGSLTVTVKKGKISSKIGVRVSPLDETNFPFSKSYAVPLQLKSAGDSRVLSNNQMIITFDRPFKTNVVQIPKGQNFVVKLADDVPDSSEITIQAQYMFDEMTSVNGTTINMGYYGRLLPKGIQIKDGGTDTDFHLPGGETIKTGRWYQITFVITQDKKMKIYFDGKLEQTLDRSIPGIQKSPPPPHKDPVRSFAVGNADYSYSHKYKIREIRLWSRALTEAEINDNLYLPVDSNAEGLVAYVPLNNPKEGFVDKSKYNNTISFGIGGAGNSTKDVFEKNVKWTENVKFPAESLEIEN